MSSMPPVLASETPASPENDPASTLRINHTHTGIRARAAANAARDLDDAGLYFNRELSTLRFHVRVLEQALDESHPLLERLTFLLIFSSNLDEFFEIRVAGLKRRMAYGNEEAGMDGHSTSSVFHEIATTAHEQVERQYHILNTQLIPALAERGIHFLRRNTWSKAQREWVGAYFDDEIMPVISPIGLDPSHPFPRLVNKSLNFIVELEGRDAFGREGGMAIIPAPRSLPRLIRLPKELEREGCQEYVFLSSMIHAHAEKLFPGMTRLLSVPPDPQCRSCHGYRGGLGPCLGAQKRAAGQTLRRRRAP